jgi:hypothetical protein
VTHTCLVEFILEVYGSLPFSKTRPIYLLCPDLSDTHHETMSEAVPSATNLIDSPAPGVKRPRVFFDITINNSKVGRVVFELFSDIG